MKSTEKHIHLFGPSGCISESSFFKYLNDDLTPSEMHVIENHLSECLFCSDALEGYEKQSDKGKVQQDFLAIKNEFLLKQNKQQEFKKKDNKRYLVLAVSIAASFILIISGYYLFQILPTNSKQQELALQSPSQKNDISEVTNHADSRSENLQEEKSGKDKGAVDAISQSEFKPELKKNTKSEQVYGYISNREGLLETDGDAISTITATGKSGEYKSIITTETTKSQEQMGGDGVAAAEDAENSGHLDDVTTALNQKDEQKKESVPVKTKATAEEVISVNDLRFEEKVVLGKKDKWSDRNKNEKQPAAATGGVLRTVTPTLNTAISDYNSGNYDQALTQFEYLTEQDKTNYAAAYYQAMCYYYIGKKDSALIQLDKLINKKNNPFYELGMWQKAQIVEESNDKKHAVEIYHEIIKNNGSMKDRAIKKVDELEKSE
jgi:tetratricopeptide (TPR) repeat protein